MVKGQSLANIRDMLWSDRPQVMEIYYKYFNHTEYPNFLDSNEFKCPFIVESDNKIALAGGVKLIAEAVVVTDQNQSVKVRQEALLQAMGSIVHIATDIGHRQVYAFVANDEQYIKHLQKYGFRLMDAKLLVLDLGEKNG